MKPKEIIKKIKYTHQLIQLHEKNKWFTQADGIEKVIFFLERNRNYLLDPSHLKNIRVSKQVIQIVDDIMRDISIISEQLQKEIPMGVLDLLKIKGMGVNKVKKLWKEMGIDSLEKLEQLCKNNSLEKQKGFGKKTQQAIVEELDFLKTVSGKLLFIEAKPIAQQLCLYLQKSQEVQKCAISGQLRRNSLIIDTLCLIVVTKNKRKVIDFINTYSMITQEDENSSIFIWRGKHEKGVKLEIHFCYDHQFYSTLFFTSSTEKHFLQAFKKGIYFYSLDRQTFSSEEEIYQRVGMNCIPIEMREGHIEFQCEEKKQLDKIVSYEEIQGVIHVHSQYSDGNENIEKMVNYCLDKGFHYLGITDHSKSAFYANGLCEERVKKQHIEIDALNKKYAPFKIFKGIESDILMDGSLDYDEELLSTFDFVIASIHSGLSMDANKATKRLIKAITDPYTTILGHLTGRLLLRRKGYPLYHKEVIDACQTHKVSIELNVNPYRMDMDWKWLHYAQEKGVKICITPDAHQEEDFEYLKLGMAVAKKGGLLKKNTLNALNRDNIEKYFLSSREE